MPSAKPIAVQQGFVVGAPTGPIPERLGLSPRDLVGKTCHQVMAGRETPCPDCPLLKASARHRQGDVAMGTSLFRLTTFRNEELSGEQVVVHYQDITNERRLQDQLHENERLAALGQLASGAAIEINNPLSFLQAANLRQLRTAVVNLNGVLQGLKIASEIVEPGREKTALAVLKQPRSSRRRTWKTAATCSRSASTAPGVSKTSSRGCASCRARRSPAPRSVR